MQKAHVIVCSRFRVVKDPASEGLTPASCCPALEGARAACGIKGKEQRVRRRAAILRAVMLARHTFVRVGTFAP